jgi:hypothetical protein
MAPRWWMAEGHRPDAARRSRGRFHPSSWKSRRRHGPVNVMKVAARHKGDFGLDYYCLCDRVAYQCYAVQEPCEVADRAEKQKAKITTDLKKFSTRRELVALFSGTKLTRWILVVPIHDSAQVNLHLTAKATQVRAIGLPYVADDFEVLIHDLDCFDADSREARALHRRLITLPPQPATMEQIQSWAQASNPLVTALSGKLAKRLGSHDPSRLDEYVDESIGLFLEKENALESLRQDAPQLHEALAGVISRHATRLSFIGSPEQATAQQILKSEVETLVAEFKHSVGNLSDDSAQQLALGTIVEWLMRCPLDFPPYGHVV